MEPIMSQQTTRLPCIPSSRPRAEPWLPPTIILDSCLSPAHAHAVPQSLVQSSHQPYHHPPVVTSPPTSGMAASSQPPRSPSPIASSPSPAKLSKKLRLDLPQTPCQQKLREAKSVPGYVLHAASYPSEPVLEFSPSTEQYSTVHARFLLSLLPCCPTCPDTPSSHHHHAGAVSTGCRTKGSKPPWPPF